MAWTLIAAVAIWPLRICSRMSNARRRRKTFVLPTCIPTADKSTVPSEGLDFLLSFFIGGGDLFADKELSMMFAIFLAMASTRTTTGFTLRDEDFAAFFISRNPNVLYRETNCE
jgi:hypothetical protein